MPEEKPAPAGGSSDRNMLAALCYIPLLFISLLVPLYILLTEKKQDKFLAFHAWQSLLITIVCIVLFGGLFAVQIVLTVLTGGLGALFGCLLLPLGLVVLIGVLFLAWKAYQGEKYKVPVLGDFSDKQANK